MRLPSRNLSYIPPDTVRGWALRLLIWITLIVIICPSLSGQTPWSFRHLTQDQGLPANSYNSFVYLDSRDLLWIGSIEGVVRYDGLEFVPYPVGVPGGIFDKYVQSHFFEDRRGDLWFATYQALNCYRRKLDRFVTYQLKDKGDELIETGYKVIHLEVRNDRLWLMAGERLISFQVDKPAQDYQVFDISLKSVRFAVDTTTDGTVRQIYGCGWDSSRGIELLSYQSEKQTWEYEQHLVEGSKKVSLSPPTITAALVQDQEHCWLFSDQGLLRFCNSLPDQPEILSPPAIPRLSFVAGAAIDTDRLLLSSKNEGLWEYRIKADQFTQISTDRQLNGLAHNSPRELYWDKQRRLWVTHTNHGLDVSEYPRQPFQVLLDQQQNKQAVVKFLLEDQQGRVWVATEVEGIYLFSKQQELIKHLPYRLENQQGLALKRLSHLSQDRNGDIWGVSGSLICRFDPHAERWQVIHHDSQLQFWRLFHLSTGRSLVLTDRGVMDLQNEGDTYSLKTSPDFAAMQGFSFAMLYERSNGDILIPYSSKELLIGRMQDNRLQLIDTLMVGADILSFQEDERGGGLWLGTSQGLTYLDQARQVRDTFRAAWEIGSVNIYALQQDHWGNLWVASSRGLWQYDQSRQQLVHYQKEDGLPGNEFSFNAVLQTDQQWIWFGTSQGLLTFRPEKIKPYPYPPKVLVRQLLVNNHPYEGPTFLAEADSVVIKHGRKTLDFQLVAPGYHLPELNTLRYRLLPWDQQWRVINNGGHASFPNLDPGGYILEMQAFNANHVAGTVESVYVEIVPYFWQTLWFKFLAVALIVLAIYLIARSYVQAKLREQQLRLERQAALEAERTRIADELHDDMGVGLTAILYAIDDFADQEDTEKKSSLERIAYRAKELLEKKEEIIWALDHERNSLQDLIVHLRQYASEYLSENQLQLIADFPEQLPDMAIGGETRRHILLISKEILHNICKHARASAVNISITIEEERRMICLFQDNGVGLQKDIQQTTGRGMRSMQRRVEAVDGELTFTSSLGKGTTARLAVPLQHEEVPPPKLRHRLSSYLSNWKKTWFFS